MSNLSGFANAKARLDVAKQERAEKMAKGGTGYLRFESGVPKLIRPLCDLENEPYIFVSHFIKRLNRGFVCMENDDCVACQEKEAGDKGIGKSQRAAISVWDYTVLHKVAKKGKKDEFDYEICTLTEDEPCKWCDRKIEARMVGKRYWEMSMTSLETLLVNQNNLSKRCGSCGTGKIKHKDWECEECGEVLEVGADDVRVTCGSCKHVGPPKEVIACSNCKEPRRATINDCDWWVTKSGEGVNTVYVMNAEPFSDLDPKIFEKPEFSEPIDFKLVLAPPSVKDMKKAMGLDFSRHDGGGAQSYDDPQATPEAGDEYEAPQRPGRRSGPPTRPHGGGNRGFRTGHRADAEGRGFGGSDPGDDGQGNIPW